MTGLVDEDLLDDPARLEAADPVGMLRAVASGSAQVREAATLAAEADLGRLGADGRPRAVVVCAMGASAVAGDVLAAVAGLRCPVPVVVHRGYDLPAWVGAADLVVGVSCSGTTEETLSALDAANRRGVRLLTVGAAGSPLAQRAADARAPHVPVPTGRQPRASLWSLVVPVLLAAAELGLLDRADGDLAESLAATAVRLEQLAAGCGPAKEAFANPAKQLALSLRGTLPMVWGSSGVPAVAAFRLGCQLATNARSPALTGAVPEAQHNQVVTLDGPWAGRGTAPGTGAGAGPGSHVFYDPDVDGPRAGAPAVPLSLLLLRESGEHPQVAARMAVAAELAEARAVPVQTLVAEGATPLERLASLVGLTDWASVYLALLLGVDPTPVEAIGELKARIGR